MEFLLSKHKHFRNFSKIMNQIVSGSSNLGPSSVSEKLQHSSLALSSWKDLAALTLRLALSSWTDILIAGQCSNSSYCLVFLVFYAMACDLHKLMNIALGLYPKLVGSMSTGGKQKLLFSSLRMSSHPKVSQNQFYFFYLVWQK